MLLGEYEHTIDDKNRLTLPAKFRQAFEDGVVVTRGLDGCLWAWTPDGWAGYRDSTLASFHPLSQQGRRMQRHFFSGASETAPFIISIDQQGNLRVGLEARPVTIDQLKAELLAQTGRNPDLKLAISADKAAPWGQIVKVRDAAAEAKIKIISAFMKETKP